MTEIDTTAPVRAASEIDVDAPAERVWDTLTDLGSWPTWMDGTKSVTTHGTFTVGTAFEWKNGPGTIKSEVLAADRPGHVAWSGRTMGIRAVHVWTIEARGSATTHVRTAESWAGLLPRLLRGPLAKTLRRALDGGVQSLKAEAERRANG
jgi:carbon monoxide dehydrogenase subunit G